MEQVLDDNETQSPQEYAYAGFWIRFGAAY